MTKKNDQSHSFSHVFLWWTLSEEHLAKQVKEYDRLNIKDSARKLSSMLLMFSAVLTIVFVSLSIVEAPALLDVFLFSVLAFFIWKGHRWAMLSAMILWTLDKFLILFEGINSGQVPNFLIHLTWWSAYMHYFYLAFRVEQMRAKSSKK